MKWIIDMFLVQMAFPNLSATACVFNLHESQLLIYVIHDINYKDGVYNLFIKL